MNRATALVLAAAVIFPSGACGATTPPTPAPTMSAAPTPEQQLLAQAHAEQWPAPDDQIVQLGHQQCPAAGAPASSTDLAVNFVILDTKFTQQQAMSLVYTSRRLFCPDAVGQ